MAYLLDLCNSLLIKSLHLLDTPWEIYSNGHLPCSNTSFCNMTWPPIYVATTFSTYLVGCTYISHFFFVLQSGSAKERAWTLIKECSLSTTTKFPSCNLRDDKWMTFECYKHVSSPHSTLLSSFPLVTMTSLNIPLIYHRKHITLSCPKYS